MASAATTASSQPDKFLSVNNIEVVYSHVILVLKGVSLSVPKGGIVALLGANGAGKSTTLKAISNLLLSERGQVTKGRIFCRGERVDGLTPNDLVRRGVIQVMEGRHCFGHLTVEENLDMGAYSRSGSRTEAVAIRADRDHVYALFPRLAERRRQTGGTLSGGEQQMLAIARALMSSPKVLLVDEPSVGLSPLLVSHTITKIRELKEKYQLTVLMAEQNFNQAIRIADHGYIIVHGEIVFQGDVDTVKNNELVKIFYLGVAA